MEALSILENKISSLLELIKGLKAENGSLKKECEQLKTEGVQLTEERARLHDENAELHEHIEQLTSKLEAMEKSVFAHDKDVETLSQEKAETKLLIDDLIKDIDSLVKSENQQ